MTALAAVGSIPSCRYILPNVTANRYTKSRNAAGRYSCFRAASSSSHLNVCRFPVCCCIIYRLSISYSLLISGVHSVNSLGNRLGVHTVHSQCLAPEYLRFLPQYPGQVFFNRVVTHPVGQHLFSKPLTANAASISTFMSYSCLSRNTNNPARWNSLSWQNALGSGS